MNKRRKLFDSLRRQVWELERIHCQPYAEAFDEIKRLLIEAGKYNIFAEREKARRAAYFSRSFPKVVKKIGGRVLCVEDVRGGCKGSHYACRTPDGELHRSFKAALSHLDNERVLAEQREALHRQQVVERRVAWEKKQEIRRAEQVFRKNGFRLKPVSCD